MYVIIIPRLYEYLESIKHTFCYDLICLSAKFMKEEPKAEEIMLYRLEKAGVIMKDVAARWTPAEIARLVMEVYEK